MIRKYNIVQNEDLTAQKIIVLLITEQALQAEANSNIIANVTLSLDLHFSILPSGLSDCSLGSVSSTHKQMPGHRQHSHHSSDDGSVLRAGYLWRFKCPQQYACSMFHSENHWLFLPLWSMSLYTYIFFLHTDSGSLLIRTQIRQFGPVKL